MDSPRDSDHARSDPYAPPQVPCECYCLHCQRVVTSADMWYQEVIGAPGGPTGFWKCPTPNCRGAGFAFDIFPTDPDHPANEGWHFGSDDEDFGDGEAEPETEYDPDEPQYADLPDDDDDDLDGEEWKHGLQPGERPPESPELKRAREAWEAQQRKYDEPDRRPRTIDGSHWRDRRPVKDDDAGAEISDDDIPF